MNIFHSDWPIGAANALSASYNKSDGKMVLWSVCINRGAKQIVKIYVYKVLNVSI